MFGFWRRTDQSTAFRENYRLSHNLTSYYFLIGTTQWPNVPVAGNAGTNLGQYNNSDFYYQTLKAFNKHYMTKGININQSSFAVNFSEFYPLAGDPDDTGPNQGCYYKENRCKGTALYAVEFLSVMNQRGIFTGYNTSEAKPWSLFLEYAAVNPYQGNTLFNSYFNYDCVFMKEGGLWTVIGRN